MIEFVYCTHSLGTPGAPCPWCRKIVPATVLPAVTGTAGVSVGLGSPSLTATPPAPSPAGVPARQTVTPAGNSRLTDPDTSHAAAASQTPGKVRAIHERVIDLFMQFGPLTDFELARKTGLKQTSVGCRRKELVTVGLVKDSGRKGVSDTGAACIRWELTTEGRMVALSAKKGVA